MFDTREKICYPSNKPRLRAGRFFFEKRGTAMEETFDFLNMSFFTRASIFPGSVGTFRYRFQRSGWVGKEGSAIQVWVYENTSFELAKDVETETFPWTEEGVEAIKAWLEEKLEARGTEPYRIPYPAKKNDVLEQPE